MAADDPFGPAPTRAPRNPISRRRIEVVISRSVAAFGLIYVAFAVGPVIMQSPAMQPAWNVIVLVSVFGGLVASLVLSLLNRGVRAVNGYFTVAWFVGMLSWPLAIINPTVVADDPPWLFYLLAIAAATGAVAWPTWAASAALAVLSATYGIVRATPAGGGVGIERAALDSIYAILLGGAAVMLVTLLRQAAAAVDLAQATAIDRYSNAVREHATEVERVHVDAIVHDSVLTTFLSAARAATPEAKRLAGQMAENAMGYLRGAATSVPDAAGSMRLQELANSVRAAASDIPVRIVVRRGSPMLGELPTASGEAVYAAAVQAMMNSAQHAGTESAVRRWVVVRPWDGGGIEVEVGDTGVGFDPAVLSRERIGVRVSIVERMANSGGAVEIESAPGKGAVLRIRWPAETDASMVGAPAPERTAR